MALIDPALPRELFGWHSPRLSLDMPIVRYGNRGRALLLFPTAQADFLENERFQLIKAIEPMIFAGRLQVFSIDSINKHAWMNREVAIPEKARRQVLYSGYVEEEVVPHIRLCLQNPSARIAVSGASFGAFHAGNAFFRRPDLFDTLIGMSGFYDLRDDYLHGYGGMDAYFNNPMQFMANVNDARQLDLFRHSQIHLLTGSGDYERPEYTQRMSQLLWNKGIWNNLEIWGRDIPHDWPSWRKMLNHYVNNRLGW